MIRVLCVPVVLLLSICLRGPAAAQTPPETVTLKPVAGPVYALEGPGGNVGVVTDPSGVILIDALYATTADKVRSAIKDLPGGARIRTLVNTHWHGDHTDGNQVLGLGTTIVAHENVRTLLSADQESFGRPVRALPPAARPNLTYRDRLALYADGHALRLVHYPHAHTDGDTVVFIDDLKVVHMGDMFFNGTFPYLDWMHGGDIDSWATHLSAILAELPPDTRVIPGHGLVAGVAELRAFRQMLVDCAGIVRRQIAAGRTLDEVKAAGLPERYEPLGRFLPQDRWLEMVYGNLTKTAGFTLNAPEVELADTGSDVRITILSKVPR